ncbi:LLM class flavin-dependent oxidoreductase [Kozakia baliensis]|uniref:LLM class flavin-dependent oxidoreductase n=1 Tax=Kozakia baliensis TaxID=153496 RepID=UPI00345BEFE7
MVTSRPPFELGIYSFGNTPQTADDDYRATAQAVRDVLEAAHVADQVGLDFFGFGEHHVRSMPISSPTSLVNAAAATTRRIRLGTAVTVLSTDDPVRVFQQLATAAAIAPDRIDLVVGRGSSPITFPLFDADERQYEELFESKLDLLQAINAHERVTWSGPHRRRALDDMAIVTRPEYPLYIWLGSGGSPESLQRAVERGLPLFLGILGGSPEHWVRYGQAYRQAWRSAGRPEEDAALAIGVHGFIAEDDRWAKAYYFEHEQLMFGRASAETGRSRSLSPARAADYEPGGMVFAGSPNEIAERVIHLHELVGHARQVFQMDAGGMPQSDFLRSIELLGTKVLPQIP